jgi:hypothetical protein
VYWEKVGRQADHPVRLSSVQDFTSIAVSGEDAGNFIEGEYCKKGMGYFVKKRLPEIGSSSKKQPVKNQKACGCCAESLQYRSGR